MTSRLRLAILNGYIELLQSEKLGPLNDRQREILGDMHTSGQRLQHFIQDFLSYSALETGEMKMRYETGNVNACLSEVCRLWSHRFQERGLALYFLANEKLPDLPFDSAKIAAGDFESAGERLQVHARRRHGLAARGALHVGAPQRRPSPAIPSERRRQNTRSPNAVKVSVSDTGPGIPPEYHIEVFDDFFRLPQNEAQTEGMGLGLAIARRLVNAMGGKIWVESELGAGCEIFISSFRSNQSRSSSAKGKNEMTEAVNILLVDDEPGMLRYIRTLLEVDDYKVRDRLHRRRSPAAGGEGPASPTWCCSTC